MDHIHLHINEIGIEDTGEAVLIYPGRRNTLSAKTDDRMNGSYRIVLEVLAPDGRTRREEKGISENGTAHFDLGPFAVPSVYEYEAGVVYRRGYNLIVTVFEAGSSDASDVLIARFELHQGCTQHEHADSLFFGSKRRVEYIDGWIPEGGTWMPFSYSGRPMDPPIDFRLDPGVLADQDAVAVMHRLRHDSPELQPITGILVGRDQSGKEIIGRQQVLVEEGWKRIEIDVAKWKSGRYYFEIFTEIEGAIYEEGPVLEYKRIEIDPNDVPVSPLAPFALKRDRQRPEIKIDDWRLMPVEWLEDHEVSENEPAPGWEVVEENGASVLRCRTDEPRNFLVLNPDLVGVYAVFLKPAGSLYIGVGDGLLRPMSITRKSDCFASIPLFIFAGNMTKKKIQIVPAGDAEVGVDELLLIPVTEESVDAFVKATQLPPLPLRGISDWWVYFASREMTYLEEDQFDMILAGHREIGISSANWAIGRSWVTYHSKLPRASMYPCTELPEDPLPDFPASHGIRRMVNDFDALGYPAKRRSEYGMQISNWLGMNRHYSSDTRGGTHTSPWVRSHPELHFRLKNSDQPDVSRVEFLFEESRRERIDILVESARYDTDGVVVGWCRQPPHAGYHPEMVEEYKKLTGDDPLEMDYSDGQKYLDWLKWRCEKGTTRLMRDLRNELAAVEEETGRRIPVIARVPTGGFLFDMAMGMDTKTWIEEGLIDELQLDPLENRCGGFGSHDVRPYLQLCRKRGIPVFGGVNGTTGTRPVSGLSTTVDEGGPMYSPAVGIRRAIGLIDAGVDGIEVYESEQFAHMRHGRWLIPLWGNAELAKEFLDDSNLEAVYPITATNAACGHDNHWTVGHSVCGTDRLPRGATRLL